MDSKHRVVIIGGGFGGLAAARKLGSRDVQVELVDRRNFHLFQPLLYQVATGELSPANIASPLRAILRKSRNVQVLYAAVKKIDLTNRTVELETGQSHRYDSLIVAAGATHSYFGNDQWAPFAPGLKTIEDATLIRRRILSAFEKAELASDPEIRKQFLTFVIVGSGPTGVEMAGALSEVAHYALRHDFRSIDPSEAKILLIEAGEKPLGMYNAKLQARTLADLERLQVTFLGKSKVTGIDEHGVVISGPAGEQQILAKTVIWSAGVSASKLGAQIAEQSGAELDRAGRVSVLPDCSIANHPEVFVIGDLASYKGADGKPLPGLAPVAIAQGKFVASKILARAAGKKEPEALKYRDRGSMAVIGRYAAVALVGGRSLSGPLAWLFWIVIHLWSITQFRNRWLVMWQWGWTYFTRDRHARLITDPFEDSLDSADSHPETTR